MTELWVLQGKGNRREDRWQDVTAPVPLEEILTHVSTMLALYASSLTQHYYRAYCTTNSSLENLHWEVLPDFPEFEKWVVVGNIAQMDDGSIWSLM